MSSNPFDERDVAYDEGLGGKKVTEVPSTKNGTSTRNVTSTHLNSEIGTDYSNCHFAEKWLYVAITCHLIQFSVLLSVKGLNLSRPLFGFLVFLVLLVPILLIYGRWIVVKKKTRDGGRCVYAIPNHPDEETDSVPDMAIHAVSVAAIFEGVALALYSVSVVGNESAGADRDVVVQALRFASITLLCFHRILRPANRVDPLRTVMELEVVSVCWDALDGSALFELIDGNASSVLVPLSDPQVSAAKVLMGFWYLSVGFRLTFMFFTHLSADSVIISTLYRFILPKPLELSRLPTVDRTLQAMRVRAIVVLAMSLAEVYAVVLRIVLWVQGSLDGVQQDLALKNIMFIISAYSAYIWWTSTVARDWNSRDLGFGFKIPTREHQRIITKWVFVICYLVESAVLTSFLLEGGRSTSVWGVNILFDICLLLFFVFYCANTHMKSSRDANHWLLPQKGFVIFPSRLIGVTSGLLMISLFIARVPAIYEMFEAGDRGGFTILTNATLVISLSIVTITALGLYLSNTHMIFEREFTIAPGNYHAIHDPTISMVCTATMVEGSLDVLSASTLVGLASFGLPEVVNRAVQFFALLEIANACQCFALQALLSGGHNDTPGDLVKWKARIRACRAVIDFGTFVLRIVLWVHYDALSSVFLIKNIYNLLHSIAMVERAWGVDKYSKNVLFMEYVPANEWYGLSPDQWRVATSTSLITNQVSTRRL